MQLFDINGMKISEKQLKQKFRGAKSRHDAILKKLENGDFNNVWEYFDVLIVYNYYRVLNNNSSISLKVKH